MNLKEDFIKNNFQKLTNKELAKKLSLHVWDIAKILKDNNLTRRNFIKNEDLLQDEYFTDIDGFSKYEISNFCRFRRKDNFMEVRTSITPDGYHSIKLVNNEGRRITTRVTTLVGKRFLINSDPKNKTEINHIDGDKNNNKFENLEWVTPSENQRHAYALGLREPIRGEDHHHAKHNEEQITEVCKLLESNYSASQIRKKYPDISESVINSVRRRDTWKHISKDYKF